MAANRNEQRLLEAMWLRIQPLLPGHPVHTRGGRLFVNAIIYIAVTGIAWDDLPRC